MRVEPAKHLTRYLNLSEDEKKLLLQKRINNITRIVAIIIAFLSTFAFFFKILFF